MEHSHSMIIYKNIKSSVFFYTVLFMLSIQALFAQEIPPLYNFTPNEYNAGNQNWKISQSQNGFIYVANNKGLLEYDGAVWTLHPSPNNTVMRAVKTHKSRIYTGAFMEFGYWEKDDDNNLKYKSLSNSVTDKLLDDEHFWKIIVYRQWVLFQSLNRIYIYNTEDEKISIINSENTLPKAFEVGGTIYFQKMNEGLFNIEGGSTELVSAHSTFRNSIIINIYNTKKGLMIQTQDSGVYIVSNDKVSKWQVPMNKFIEGLNVYSSMQLSDGNFFIGTIAKGGYLLSKEGDEMVSINQENGLQNNTVLSIYEDFDGNIWLGLDNGISVLNYKSPYKIYEDAKGKLGAVYTSVQHNGYLYLGTNQGLFYKRANSIEEFRLIEGSVGQVWVLKVIDDLLFCGHNSGSFIVRGGKMQKISSVLGTWDFRQFNSKPNLILQGNYDGLHILEKIKDNWVYRNKIMGFDKSSRYFEIIDSTSILVNHEYKGLYQVKIDSRYEKVSSYHIDTTAVKSHNSSIFKYNNGVLYFSKNGFYNYDYHQQNFQKDSLLSKMILGKDAYISGKMIQIENALWIFTQNNINQLAQSGLNNSPEITQIPLSASARQDIDGYENISKVYNNKYLIGTSRGYILVDLDKVKKNDFHIVLNSVSKNKVGAEQISLPLTTGNVEVGTKENNLNFTYSVPHYEKLSNIQYQYKVVNLYDEWSSWSSATQVSLKNLSYGTYTFQVRAKNGNDLSENMIKYSFTINKPWYLSYFMLFLYAILFLTFIFLVNKFYKKRYNEQKTKLLDEQQKELSLINLENEKVLMKMRNDKLRSEIKSKNRELASSTISIAKNNSFLNKLKEELNKIKNSEMNKILKMIDKNLSNEDEWEVMIEAFNNIDRTFLKNIKESHPELTPSDLRLCVYLRLNLSSKEIAPLLNISSRSVEIKRYRLRKKMGLTQNQNLVSYILSV